MTTDYAREFGKHVRSLRKARGLSQESLAVRSDLSADTIRRLERGSFSASIDTLRKLCAGLAITPSTLWSSFEVDEDPRRRAVLDLLASMSDAEADVALEILRAFADGLKSVRG